jgi:hypothetical protein
LGPWASGPPTRWCPPRSGHRLGVVPGGSERTSEMKTAATFDAASPGRSSGWAWLRGSPPRSGCARWSLAGHPVRWSSIWCSGTERGASVDPNLASRAFARLARERWGLLPIRICYATPWRQRWRPTRNQPTSLSPSSATPTAAPSPNGFYNPPASPDRSQAGWGDRGCWRSSAGGLAVSARRRAEGNRGKPGPRTRAEELAHNRIIPAQGGCGRAGFDLCRQCRRFTG